jgi:hypothetical protein
MRPQLLEAAEDEGRGAAAVGDRHGRRQVHPAVRVVAELGEKEAELLP